MSVGFIVLTQMFTADAGGTVIIAGKLAMMAPSDHQHTAVIISILNLFSCTGSAAASAVSAVISTGTS